jgi:hypothetical protein
MNCAQTAAQCAHLQHAAGRQPGWIIAYGSSRWKMDQAAGFQAGPVVEILERSAASAGSAQWTSTAAVIMPSIGPATC